MNGDLTTSNYVFLPYVRLGLAACNSKVVDDQVTTGGNLDVSAKLAIKDGTSTSATPSVTLTLRGPGDVYSIASSQIVRTEPVAGATAFETNYFPFIEFARADFPWLFTPAKANESGRLRPWLALIVVESDKATYTAQSSGPARLTNITDQLPDLSQSAYWAYVQVSGSFDASELTTILSDEPERVVSRLVCPRHLKASTNYRACLVPAFKSGVDAGLGNPVTAPTSMEPAWSGSESVTLPVYYSWTFSTGEGGDFESLVRQLKAREMPPEVGVRPLDASDAGLGLPAADTKSLSYVGILKAPKADSGSWPPESPNSYQAKLTEILNESGLFTADAESDPLIAPPIYGRWHAAQDQIAATNPQWLQDLNLDPRVRVLAGMATEVIKAQQESLMASAWDQYEGIKELNSALTKAQCAREVSTSLKVRHIDVLKDDEDAAVKAQLLSPAHSRALSGEQTVKASLRATSLPRGTATAAFRRITRAGGHAGRMMRLSTGKSSTNLKAIGLFDEDNVSKLDPPTVTSFLGADLPQPSTTGMCTTDKTVTTPIRRSVGTIGGPVSNGDLSRFDEDLRVTEALAMDLPNVAQRLGEAINPGDAILRRMTARCPNLGNIGGRRDALDIVLAAPVFPQAMYSYLRDIAGDWFVPGLENVPDDTVTLLVANNPAIEAYMVGLSHEMGRELLWREFPTDQRGTYFKQFWDPASNYAASSSGTDTTDIGPIHLWHDTALGTNLHNADPKGLLVLLIRGELLRRYPDTIIYAEEVDPETGDPKKLRASDGTVLSDSKTYPLFQGTLGTDITFFGLPISQAAALGPPGYFIVVQQHPTGPRVGFDETDDGDGVSWPEVELSDGSGYANVDRWADLHSAAMASDSFQTPFRILIHASDMLPSES